MNLEQFRATGRDCDDLGKFLNNDLWDGMEPGKGRIYSDALYIEKIPDPWPLHPAVAGKWMLTIGRNQWVSYELDELEEHLFGFAIDAGLIDPPSLDELTAEYQAWQVRERLKIGSADEHTHDATLTDKQRAWLRRFSERWDMSQTAETEKRHQAAIDALATPPTIVVNMTMVGGLIQDDVEVAGGKVRIVVRDYDVEGSDLPKLKDADGDEYLELIFGNAD